MRLTNASTKAIEYACLNFHYSKSVPSVQYAHNVYNDKDEWCGVILYGGGANPHMAGVFGKNQGEVLELTRVALNGKQETTSQAVGMSLRKLKRENPIVQIVVSYADADQQHKGIIYQATNWIYLGLVNVGVRSAFIINGKKTHRRTIGSSGGIQSIKWIRENKDPNATEFITEGKHKYIYCFNKKERQYYLKLAQPYPKNNSCGNSSAVEQPSILTGEGGATPTLPLQT